MAKEKHPGGRPPKYKPEFCDAIVELGRDGLSIAEMACELGVMRQTLANWAEEYPEFLVAFTRAKEFSLAWWEKQARTGLISANGMSLNASLWSRSMAARFPAEYTERKDLTSSDGSLSPKPTEIVIRAAQ
jgi:DNA-binding XRE family transcriptional regulator